MKLFHSKHENIVILMSFPHALLVYLIVSLLINGIALDRFVARMKGWFNPLAARLVAWDALHIYEITVGDYLDTQQIYLDHYSYRGQTIQGLLPPPRI